MARKRNQSPVSLFAFQDIITSVTGIMILITLILGLELIQRKIQQPEHKSRTIAEDANSVARQIHNIIDENRRKITSIQSQLINNKEELNTLAQLDAATLERQARDLKEVTNALAQEIAKTEEKKHASQRDVQAARDAQKGSTLVSDSIEDMTAEIEKVTKQIEELRKNNRVIFRSEAESGKAPWLVELSGSNMLIAEFGKQSPPISFSDLRAFLTWAKSRNKSSDYFVLMIKPSSVDKFFDIHTNLSALGFDIGFDLLPEDQTSIDSTKGAGY